MSSLGKSDLALAVLCGLLALCMISLHTGAETLRRELATNSMQCAQRIDRLRENYRAEIEDLKQYLQDRHRFAAGVNAAVLTAQQRQPGDTDAEQAPDVERKYRYMYEVMDQRETVREMLRQLLLDRERLAASGERGEQMGALEAQIGELLGAGGYQEYQVLKDSDSEQHHLREYAESIRESAPLSQEQDRSLLFAKLKHKQAFQRALVGAGLYQEYLTNEGQEYARMVVRRAVQEYRDNYLNEVRPLLSSEQYTKLMNYETTEFGWELQRLMRQIDAKANGPHY